MEQNGEKVEAQQKRCEVLLAMAKIVLQMVPFSGASGKNLVPSQAS
jgi:hypothetical protein